MPFKVAANEALQHLTGYRLTKETLQQREASIRAARAQARKRAARRERTRWAKRERERRAAAASRRLVAREAAAARAATERAAARSSGADLPAHFDHDKRRIIAQVRPRTSSSVAELNALIEATRYVVRQQVPGEVVLCGPGRVGNAQAIALVLASQGQTDRALHLFDLFDTFDGVDDPAAEGASVQQSAARRDAEQAMAQTWYPSEGVHFHTGDIAEQLTAEAPAAISMLLLDPESPRAATQQLDDLFHRLSPGGMLVLESLADRDECREAVVGWLQKADVPFFLAPAGTAYVAVKPSGIAC